MATAISSLHKGLLRTSAFSPCIAERICKLAALCEVCCCACHVCACHVCACHVCACHVCACRVCACRVCACPLLQLCAGTRSNSTAAYSNLCMNNNSDNHGHVQGLALTQQIYKVQQTWVSITSAGQGRPLQVLLGREHGADLLQEVMSQLVKLCRRAALQYSCITSKHGVVGVKTEMSRNFGKSPRSCSLKCRLGTEWLRCGGVLLFDLLAARKKKKSLRR